MTIWGLVGGTLQCADDGARCTLRFAPSEPFFAGHFPGYPIVPGMVMLESLVRLAQHLEPSATGLSEIHDAKFILQVRPGEDMLCHVQRQLSGGFAGEITTGGRAALKVHFTL